jgi:hypothetical protein
MCLLYLVANILFLAHSLMVPGDMCVERDEKVRASLFQAVHSLQATIGPVITATIHDSETVSGIRRLWGFIKCQVDRRFG